MYNSNYSETKFVQANANSTDTSGGVVIPNGKVIALTKVRLTGADPSCYSMLVFDWGGDDEKIFMSTKDTFVDEFNICCGEYQITGDGSAKLAIIIENNNDAQSPHVGGTWEATIIE